MNSIIADGANTDETVLQGDVAAAKMTGDLLSKKWARSIKCVALLSSTEQGWSKPSKIYQSHRTHTLHQRSGCNIKLERVQALTTRVAQQEGHAAATRSEPGTTVRRRSGQYGQQAQQEQAMYNAQLAPSSVPSKHFV